MAKTLLVVESPAKVKTIKKFLKKGYYVEASMGHVRDLPKSKLGVDVENDFKPSYITIKGKGELLTKLRKLAKSCDNIYLAADPDREGEAISWHLAQALKIDPATNCRIEFNEITASAVKNALKHPRPINCDVFDAQQARRILDRIVGYKISPLLWRKVRRGLSAGRVQSVAMRLIAERENEIKAFEPKEYWILDALLKNADKELVKATYWGTKKKTELSDQQTVDEIIAELEGNPFVVKSIKESQKRRKPTAPFTTSTMQQDASSKLGFSAQKTMSVAQKLYEGVEVEGEGTVGLITYLRTDSVRTADEALTAVREHISESYGEKYLPDQPTIYKKKNTAQDAHEAIRPTAVWRTPEQIKASLSNDQLKLYTLIFNRFIASQMTPAVFANKVIEIRNGQHLFKASGSTKIFDGYTVMYAQTEKNDTKTQLLPHVDEGETLTLDQLDPQQKFTQPPSRFTEATLVKILEELGIGRPSTYAPTISTIVSRGYVEREKRTLLPTDLGMIVNDLMTNYFNQVVDYDFTANMEANLDKVAEGEMQWQKVLEGFYPVLEELLEEADKKIERIKIEDEVSDQVCEKCGAQMVIKRGRFGKFIACPNFPDCKNTKPLVEDVGTPCPQCGGKIVARKSKKGRRFYGCDNYPECKFISWYLPSKEKCPKCGKYMVIKQNKQGKIEQCSDKECGYSRTIED